MKVSVSTKVFINGQKNKQEYSRQNTSDYPINEQKKKIIILQTANIPLRDIRTIKNIADGYNHPIPPKETGTNKNIAEGKSHTIPPRGKKEQTRILQTAKVTLSDQRTKEQTRILPTVKVALIH